MSHNYTYFYIRGFMIFQLFITQKCNLNCKYCFEGEKNNIDMQESLLPHVAMFMLNYVKNDFIIDKQIWVNFNGGEALLRKEFISIAVKTFLSFGITHFSISTNFTLCDDNFLDFLIKNNFTIQLSIDGKQKTHDKNRCDYNNNGTFSIVWERINYLNKKYPNADVLYSMVFTPETIRKLYTNVKFLIKHIEHPKLIASYNSKAIWKKEDFIILKKQFKKIRKLYVNNIKQGKDIYLKSLSKNITDTIFNKKSTCGCCKDLIGIKPNGEVLACGAFLGNHYENNFKIGSVLDNKLNMELISSLLSIKIENIACNNCNFKHRCDNDCLVCNLDCTGNFNIPDYACCEINKILIKESDKAIEQLRKNTQFFKTFNQKEKK